DTENSEKIIRNYVVLCDLCASVVGFSEFLIFRRIRIFSKVWSLTCPPLGVAIFSIDFPRRRGKMIFFAANSTLHVVSAMVTAELIYKEEFRCPKNVTSR
ncbi:MAG: hypothetical protein JW849_07840, partial [Phycisphaerae bacterium]|nr:hypothetical protein [Phycisphaerae bacterium]